MGGFSQSIKYLESFIDYERIDGYRYKESFGLDRMRDFLQLIGNPQRKLKIIHVAGSKGKGSSCAFIAYILREAGFSCGLYTSPHLSDFRERIRILKPHSAKQASAFEGMIPRKELARLVRSLRPAIKEYGRSFRGAKLSFFEVYTALAFLYFAEEKVDFAVLETGMGGRLDATNAADSLICAITPISYEHTQYLGKRLKEISAEKAGIIKKRGALVVSSAQDKEAMAVIRARCAKLKARLYEVGREIKYRAQGNKFSVKGMHREYPGLKLRLPGRHQLANACLAIGVVEALAALGFNISIACVRRGLYNTFWPARCELLLRRPLVVVDGAQNCASAAALKTAIKENFCYRRLILVFGVCRDKDIRGIAGQLQGLAQTIILTRAHTPRAACPDELAGYFMQGTAGRQLYITKSVRQAGRLALRIAGKKDLILATGSLFVAGEFRRCCRIA